MGAFSQARLCRNKHKDKDKSRELAGVHAPGSVARAMAGRGGRRPSCETEWPQSHRVEETALQYSLNRFIATRQRGRPAQALIAVDSLRPGIYLRAPVVRTRSGRRRAAPGREPATVLLGPFVSEVEARFIQTSAQVLGLVVERMDVLPLGSGYGDARVDRNYPTRIDFFSCTDLALN